MRQLAYLLAFALCATTPTLYSTPVFAQDAAAVLAEDDAPAVTPQEVQDALVEALSASGPEPESAITTTDPEIAPGALDIMLSPMTQGEIRNEISAWFEMFKTSVADLAEGEMELFELNAAEDKARAEAEEKGVAPELAEGEISPAHEALIEANGELRAVRTGIADRLRVALDAFEGKGGDPAANDEIRNYITDVSGVEVDVTNAQTAMLTIKQWVFAEDGGRRWLEYIVTVLGATLVCWALGWLLGVFLSFGLRRTELTSKLLARFVRVWMARVGALVGLLMGLSWIGTNMTPILAALGAGGFILAFALQNTISNFASGLLILFQRPFDAGDEIEAAGVTGDVESVSLFSTHLSTAENRKVIVPNNMIWEDVIVNSTGAPTRRLQIEIEVSAEKHSLEDAERILSKIMAEHPDVLEDPAADLKLASMSDESYTFICWPWVETSKKDTVRWDLVSQFGHSLNVIKGVTEAA